MAKRYSMALILLINFLVLNFKEMLFFIKNSILEIQNLKFWSAQYIVGCGIHCIVLLVGIVFLFVHLLDVHNGLSKEKIKLSIIIILISYFIRIIGTYFSLGRQYKEGVFVSVIIDLSIIAFLSYIFVLINNDGIKVPKSILSIIISVGVVCFILQMLLKSSIMFIIVDTPIHNALKITCLITCMIFVVKSYRNEDVKYYDFKEFLKLEVLVVVSTFVAIFMFNMLNNGSNRYGMLSDEEKEWYEHNYGDDDFYNDAQDALEDYDD